MIWIPGSREFAKSAKLLVFIEGNAEAAGSLWFFGGGANVVIVYKEAKLLANFSLPSYKNSDY